MTLLLWLMVCLVYAKNKTESQDEGVITENLWKTNDYRQAYSDTKPNQTKPEGIPTSNPFLFWPIISCWRADSRHAIRNLNWICGIILTASFLEAASAVLLKCQTIIASCVVFMWPMCSSTKHFSTWNLILLDCLIPWSPSIWSPSSRQVSAKRLPLQKHMQTSLTAVCSSLATVVALI